MLAASWSIHQLPAQTNSGGASQELRLAPLPAGRGVVTVPRAPERAKDAGRLLKGRAAMNLLQPAGRLEGELDRGIEERLTAPRCRRGFHCR